jgi:hypothetical protein
MAKSDFISIETMDGIVHRFEGAIGDEQPGWRTALWGGANELLGKRINDVLQQCAAAGYQHMATELIGDKVVYRLRLKSMA